MTNEEIRATLEQRTRLEDRIRILGGEIPRPWTWDDRGQYRNLQLLEHVEMLEVYRHTDLSTPGLRDRAKEWLGRPLFGELIREHTRRLGRAI